MDLAGQISDGLWPLLLSEVPWVKAAAIQAASAIHSSMATAMFTSMAKWYVHG